MPQKVLAGVGGYRGARAAFIKRSPRPPMSRASPINQNLKTKSPCDRAKNAKNTKFSRYLHNYLKNY